MFANSLKRAALVVACGLIAGCATSGRDIQTPTGAVRGQIAGPYVVIGVGSVATSTLNRPDGAATFEETVRVDVPAGTEVIVPVLSGWSLGFGSTDPADLSGETPPEATFVWHASDHHWGMGRVDVSVTDIDAAAPGATTQSATIRVRAQLVDNNADDPWWGLVRYQLIFLGRMPPR